MKVNMDETVHRRHVLDRIDGCNPMASIDSHGDSRLIPFGAILRASGMDDLPQLINVWRGEMSLVGPRPCTSYELETCLPRQRVRFEALPGLTGPWRVSGRNRTTLNELIELDIRYVQSRSLRLDLSVMAKTFVTVVQQVARLSRGDTSPEGVPAG